MRPFLVSVMWRNLAVDLDSSADSITHQLELDQIETRWNALLRQKSDSDEFGAIHLIVTNAILKEFPQFNEYFARLSDASTISTDSSGLVGYYAKFARFIVVADFGLDTSGWARTLVHTPVGQIEPNPLIDKAFRFFLCDRAERQKRARAEINTRMSPGQKAAVEQNVKNLGLKYTNSELHSAIVQDSTWDLQIPRVGRNHPCPCLSGKKYKKCHGR